MNLPRRPQGVLVVDDPSVRAIIRAALSRLGYSVWLADCGRQALELYAGLRGEIDLVLLDVLMPGGLDGLQTLAGPRLIEPRVRAAFVTGFACDRLADHDLPVIAKPFSLDALAEVVRDALA
jgi:CheY-like chemotaxis protein